MKSCVILYDMHMTWSHISEKAIVVGKEKCALCLVGSWYQKWVKSLASKGFL